MDRFADELVWLLAILVIGGIALMSASGVVQCGSIFAIVFVLLFRGMNQ